MDRPPDPNAGQTRECWSCGWDRGSHDPEAECRCCGRRGLERPVTQHAASARIEVCDTCLRVRYVAPNDTCCWACKVGDMMDNESKWS
jgi:hypothetical protein